MEALVGFIILLSFPLYFGYQHISYFSESPFSYRYFGITSILASVLFLLYLFLFFYLGLDGLYELTRRGRKSFNIVSAFLLPSIGFGIAIFNIMAADFMKDFEDPSANKYYRTNRLTACILGWLIIAFLMWNIYSNYQRIN
jgi:hypothetical protein